jgi:xeroderma pigmentosum group C-complementing protein
VQAYYEYEDQRAAQLLKKREEQAATRWRQLLLSVATRKRLRETYQGDPSEAATFTSKQKLSDPEVTETVIPTQSESAMDSTTQSLTQDKSSRRAGDAEDPAHVHHYVESSDSYDAETGITTKRCECGSMIQVEEM